eukprot:3411854-Pleurochrysis_carterae.AAC.5
MLLALCVRGAAGDGPVCGGRRSSQCSLGPYPQARRRTPSCPEEGFFTITKWTGTACSPDFQLSSYMHMRLRVDPVHKTRRGPPCVLDGAYSSNWPSDSSTFSKNGVAIFAPSSSLRSAAAPRQMRS